MKYSVKISTRFSDYNMQKILKASTQFDIVCEACKEFFEVKLGYNVVDLAKKSLRFKITDFHANYLDDISYRDRIRPYKNL